MKLWHYAVIFFEALKTEASLISKLDMIKASVQNLPFLEFYAPGYNTHICVL